LFRLVDELDSLDLTLGDAGGASLLLQANKVARHKIVAAFTTDICGPQDQTL